MSQTTLARQSLSRRSPVHRGLLLLAFALQSFLQLVGELICRGVQ